MSAMSRDNDVVELDVVIGVFTLCDDQLQGGEGLGGKTSCWVNRDGKAYPLVIQPKNNGQRTDILGLVELFCRWPSASIETPTKHKYLLIIQGNHLGKRRHHSLFTEHNPLPHDRVFIHVSLPVPPLLHPRLHYLLYSVLSDMLTQTMQNAFI